MKNMYFNYNFFEIIKLINIIPKEKQRKSGTIIMMGLEIWVKTHHLWSDLIRNFSSVIYHSSEKHKTPEHRSFKLTIPVWDNYNIIFSSVVDDSYEMKPRCVLQSFLILVYMFCFPISDHSVQCSPNGHSRKRTALLMVTFIRPRFNQPPNKLCIFHSHKRPAPVTEKPGCLLMRASTIP